ncbi:MAG: hypothetical protein AVDCRST_MAG31-1681 [uncultured Sphingomonas sp.]|uniref:Regulatory protein RecX n=1 Tax=uncultured Sphingomonas sp. TaxID=158754 RepID=A0A6J4TEZ8_9SPHN|nr:hypothetical protein [uncultured Sphingomonas sp.]CAA9521938.1 MAG: hypothetical protein AVDCRST_MAG31-1681 [uncultured Sphingomonas sp.]
MSNPVESIGLVERAFQLALASFDVGEIRAKLRREGYAQVDEHLSGPSLRAALKKLMRRSE